MKLIQERRCDGPGPPIWLVVHFGTEMQVRGFVIIPVGRGGRRMRGTHYSIYFILGFCYLDIEFYNTIHIVPIKADFGIMELRTVHGNKNDATGGKKIPPEAPSSPSHHITSSGFCHRRDPQGSNIEYAQRIGDFF